MSTHVLTRVASKRVQVMVYTRYAFGKGGTVFATKVVPGGTTKNVPPGTIFARYNYCVTVPTVPKLVPRGVINTNLKDTNKWKSSVALHFT